MIEIKYRVKRETFTTKKGETKSFLPEINPKGEFIDLRSNEEVFLKRGESKVVDLGIAVEMPKGFEMVIVARSSSFNNYGIIMVNGMAVIDQPYCGNEDFIKCPIFSLNGTHIKIGDRICQFKIQLSQKANFWQKLKWLFSNSIKLTKVDNLTNPNRGGLGKSGKN